MLLLMWRKDKYYVLHGMTLNWWFTSKSPITLQGIPAATLLSGMSFATIEPAPIITLSPIDMQS